MAKAKKKTTKKKTTKKKTTTKKAATKKKATKKAATSKKTATKKAAKKTTAKTATTKKITKPKAVKPKTASATKSLKTYDAQVSVGKPVPDFTLPQTGQGTFQLANFKGKKVVIYFYPKDATPGCTVEGQDFTRLHNEFKTAGVEVFGVSRDSMKSHESFKTKQGYSIDLLSDEEEKLCAIFGVIKLKNMYGKQVRGIERSTFLIDENGNLAQEWRGVKVPGHADEVLSVVKPK